MQRRHISGVILLDKPQGITSQQAVTRVKRAFQAIKGGHTGSLDPLATGMLPICLGEATKFADYLLSAKKTYTVIAQLGICTNTGDAEGEIINQHPVTPEHLQQIEHVLPQFQGTISQIPPMYSALKHQGKPLYRLARSGITIERPPRSVTIYDMQQLPHSISDQFALTVCCSKGTYIRSLIEDIGAALGCGAHVKELRRLAVDIYSCEQMISLDKIQSCATENFPEAVDKLLMPTTTLVHYLPKAIIAEDVVPRLQQGVTVSATFDNLPEGEIVQVFSQHAVFLGIGKTVGNDKVAPKRLLATH